MSVNPGFLLLLLRLQEVRTVDAAYRLGAALYFKNFVRSNWSQVVVITSDFIIYHSPPQPLYHLLLLRYLYYYAGG